MRTIRKNVALILCAVLLLAAMAIGLTGFTAKASTLDKFEKNTGNTDFYQGFDWMGAWSLSSDILDGDKTLVRCEDVEWGKRWTCNYAQVLDGATYDADVYLNGTAGNMTIIYYTPKGAGEYFDAAGIGIYITEGASSYSIRVGRWGMNYGLEVGEEGNASKPKTLFATINVPNPESGITNIKSTLAAQDDGSWKMLLKVDGEDHEVDISAADWNAQVGSDEGWLGFAGLLDAANHGSKVKIVFNDYSDDNRKEYYEDEDNAEYFDALDAMKAAYETAVAADENTSLATVSDLLYTVTENKDLVTSQRSIRMFEKGRANWYFNQTRSILENTYSADEDAYALIQLGVAVNYFHAKSEVIETEDDVEAVEKLRQDVDADTLDDLVSLGLEGADDILDKYDEAKANLADAKDGFVNDHVTEFEEAVKDLSSNEKIVAAADLQKYVIISNAKSANRDAYTARYNAASDILKSKIKDYSGTLANNWDIHNVTFVNANKYNEIKYSASDYYNDDATNDVGITLKGKLKLDGLSFEVTVASGDYDKDSWFGFFFTKERSIFSISNHADTGLSESRGIITLVKPIAGDDDVPATTQVRMGYPNLYGNETDYDLCILDADLYGNTMKYEFKKETITDEASGESNDYYVCYITVTDENEEVVVKRYAARKLLASIVDAELDDEGMGYLTFGSCDKTLVGVEATIHTINGEAAATVTGKVDPADIGNQGNQGSQGNQGGTTNNGDGKKKGCGSNVGAFGSVALSVIALAAAGIFVSRKRKATK